MAIDDDRIRRVIIDAIGRHDSLRAAREANVFVVPARDRAIELASPLAARLCRKIIRVPWTSRIQYEDLEQSALEGIVEGIDSYEPGRIFNGRPIKPSTHLFWRVRKRVLEEVQDTHWIVAKPTRSDIEAFMKDEMTEGQREAYILAVLRPVADPELTIHSSRHDNSVTRGFLAAEGMLL